MRATGIVRRIDDLGRIVIPKEIRRELRIQEGDPLEIFVDKNENTVSFKKYEVVSVKKEAQAGLEAIKQYFGRLSADEQEALDLLSRRMESRE